ncbi:hypothetical protein N2599_32530 (plasmid) [Rhizobium sullae]|uniref:Uncharacterized protein n=1 Tax=Rhizobium sullae TaxID=50338 RepID=A0ABY5XUA9_RHISU|nr:hypothetical protein [Rhizobium sullae]UWU17468.1 hypothetical protein N2599_32530 [Rhizobium sullae]
MHTIVVDVTIPSYPPEVPEELRFSRKTCSPFSQFQLGRRLIIEAFLDCGRFVVGQVTAGRNDFS